MPIKKSFNTHTIAASVAASLFVATAPLMAQTPARNSPVEGANNFYKSDKVTMQKITAVTDLINKFYLPILCLLLTRNV